jgi:hypothetical protein
MRRFGCKCFRRWSAGAVAATERSPQRRRERAVPLPAASSPPLDLQIIIRKIWCPGGTVLGNGIKRWGDYADLRALPWWTTMPFA